MGGKIDFFGDINEFKAMYDRICAIGNNKDYFKVCVDTGHTHTTEILGFPSPGEVIRIFGKNVVALHLHDNDGLRDSHRIPGAGTVDWNDVFDALDEVGYTGNYNLEINNSAFGKNLMIETAVFSIKVLKNMLYERYGNE